MPWRRTAPVLGGVVLGAVMHDRGGGACGADSEMGRVLGCSPELGSTGEGLAARQPCAVRPVREEARKERIYRGRGERECVRVRRCVGS